MCMLSRFSCVWLCVTLWTGSSVHEVLQASILEWVSRPSSRSLPDPGIESVSLICPVLAGGFFTTSPTWETHNLYSVQFSSVTQSCPTLCDSMNRSTAGLPVHHQLPVGAGLRRRGGLRDRQEVRWLSITVETVLEAKRGKCWNAGLLNSGWKGPLGWVRPEVMSRGRARAVWSRRGEGRRFRARGRDLWVEGDVILVHDQVHCPVNETQPGSPPSIHAFLGSCCCSVAKSYLTLSNPIGCSTPGLPVPYHLPEFAQVHVQCLYYHIYQPRIREKV